MTRSPWNHLARWAAALSLVSVMIVVGGGVAVWSVERHAPQANLTRVPDAVWWAMTTLTTVGYGEHYPVTVAGRLVAVVIMVFGIAVIGAVAAMVAFGFGHHFAERLEQTMREVQQVAEHQNLSGAPVSETEPHDLAGLREVLVPVPDDAGAASVTWLLARLGWHPLADETGLGWAQGTTRLRLVVRPFTAPPGVSHRLTFAAGDPERLHRIAREATRHGFHPVPDGGAVAEPRRVAAPGPAVRLRTPSGIEVGLEVSPGTGLS